MTTIQLQSLHKAFDDVVAVDGIDLAAEDGEFLVIVGPSGCGKSTTLRLLAGLERATDGRIVMDGRDVTAVEPADRNVAMVFQNYALYPHMTGRRNITFGMKSAGSFSDDEIEARVSRAAEMLDISSLLDRKPKAMSGGERQRVALGRAIVRDPDAFLLDEPLSNLDAKLRIRMRAELRELHEELRTTSVYVTHDQTEAMTLGDRVAVMNDGRLMQVDPPQTLYDRPANRFVAEFIGDPPMNVIEVSIEGGRAVHDAFAIELPAAAGSRRDDRPFEGVSAARLGVRPEDLYLARDRPDLGETTVAATVTLTEPLGDCLLVHCSLGDDACTVRVEPRTALQPGEEIELAYDPARLHLFDPATGEAIYHAAGDATADRLERLPEGGR